MSNLRITKKDGSLKTLKNILTNCYQTNQKKEIEIPRQQKFRWKRKIPWQGPGKSRVALNSILKIYFKTPGKLEEMNNFPGIWNIRKLNQW